MANDFGLDIEINDGSRLLSIIRIKLVIRDLHPFHLFLFSGLCGGLRVQFKITLDDWIWRRRVIRSENRARACAELLLRDEFRWLYKVGGSPPSFHSRPTADDDSRSLVSSIIIINNLQSHGRLLHLIKHWTMDSANLFPSLGKEQAILIPFIIFNCQLPRTSKAGDDYVEPRLKCDYY